MGAFHRRALDYFRQYMIVGGMPQAVQTYVDTHDFDKVDEKNATYYLYIVMIYVNMLITKKRKLHLSLRKFQVSYKNMKRSLS